MESYLQELNEQQRKAVLTTTGPLLVVAGAGAGKTKTIAHRILHLVKTLVPASSILAITFTNKAAKEMRERVTRLLGEEKNGPTIATFHSLGVRLLKEFGSDINIPRGFVIFDRDDAKRAIKAALESLSIDPKRYEPAKLLSAISKAKGEGRNAHDYRARAQSSFGDIVSQVYARYESILKEEGGLDFDDLLLKTAELLSSSKSRAREILLKRFTHIHIDEYQDTNMIQYMIAKQLVGPEKNICVVGDSDQSIYGWRGANIHNILDFEKDFPETTVVLLEQNYRSTKTILAAATAIIEKNELRKEKRLFTNNTEGEKIGLYVGYDEEDEAMFVAQKTSAYIARGVAPENIAILYRANFQSRVLEQALLKAHVPYQLVGTRFFERKEVKDALSYLRLALLTENGMDLRRVLNVPTRGLGKVTLLTIIEKREHELSPAATKKLADFRNLLRRVKEKSLTESTSKTVRYLLEESGLFVLYQKGKGEDIEHLENLKELVSVATQYDHYPTGEGIHRLIEDAALMSDQDELSEKKQGVKLMTIHAAKGLEFDIVFVTGLEEGLFPHDGNGNKTKEEQEEERRLAYVAVTRSKKKLILTYAGVRTIFGLRNTTVPSIFLSDIDDLLIEAEDSGSGFHTIYM